jgi:hypothetical protein
MTTTNFDRSRWAATALAAFRPRPNSRVTSRQIGKYPRNGAF